MKNKFIFLPLIAAITVLSLFATSCDSNTTEKGPFWTSALMSSNAQPGGSYYLHQYIDNGKLREDIVYRMGNLPIVISVPHGGYLEPEDILNHSGENTMDSNTQETAIEIESALFELTGKYPHVIYNRLNRGKLDANRDGSINTGEDITYNPGSARARVAYDDFHELIRMAKQNAINMYGNCLYIDLHGHGHPYARIELGYKITGAQLLNNDGEELSVQEFEDECTVKQLLDINTSVTLDQLIRGNESFGTILENLSFPTVPSTRLQSPTSDQVALYQYYEGGYNVERHCSTAYGNGTAPIVPGFQMELNSAIRKDDTSISEFSAAFANAMDIYLKKYLNIDIATSNN